MSTPVYSSPDDPGAPVPGDIVVPQWNRHLDVSERPPGRLLGWDEPDGRWLVEDLNPHPVVSGPWTPPTVRRPTETELIAYHLSRGAQ